MQCCGCMKAPGGSQSLSDQVTLGARSGQVLPHWEQTLRQSVWPHHVLPTKSSEEPWVWTGSHWTCPSARVTSRQRVSASFLAFVIFEYIDVGWHLGSSLCMCTFFLLGELLSERCLTEDLSTNVPILGLPLGSVNTRQRQGGEGQANTRRALLELTASREQRNRHTVHHWSNSAPLSRQNRLRIISDA